MDRFTILKNPGATPCYAPVRSASVLTQGGGAPVLQGSPSMTRELLVQALTATFSAGLYSNSLARRMFHTEVLPQGVLPIYDVLARFPESAGTSIQVIDRDGNVQSRSNNGIVHLPHFYLHTNIEIPSITLWADFDLNLIDRVQNLATHQLRREEETKALGLLNSAAVEENRTIQHEGGPFRDTLHKAIGLIEAYNTRVRNIFINPQDFSHLRNLCGTSYLTENNTALPIHQQIWGIPINPSRVIPLRQIYLTAEPHQAGLFPIVRDISALSMGPTGTEILISETVCMCCNPMGIAKILMPQ